MGRPPCCDKVGIKKGPWTPEEDLILASYIQDHGPGNWRSVPTNTGLLRCSKSCRLRWTNYLRPGIKRGNFTELEEKTIISLQGLLGNKWAAIAAYLPQRTDNDIKNYWNTHLKKKLKKFQSVLQPHLGSSTTFQFLNKSGSSSSSISSYSERRNFDIYQISSSMSIPKLTNSYSSSSSSTYASSTENISRLLTSWVKPSPKVSSTTLIRSKQEGDEDDNDHNHNEEKMYHHGSSCSHSCSSNDSIDEKKDQDLVVKASQVSDRPDVIKKVEDENESCDHLISHDEFESLLRFANISNTEWEKSSSDSTLYESEIHQTTTIEGKINLLSEDQNEDHHPGLLETQQPPFSSLEKWLFDETTGEPLF